jgi:hypothetical protein
MVLGRGRGTEANHRQLTTQAALGLGLQHGRLAPPAHSEGSPAVDVAEDVRRRR